MERCACPSQPSAPLRPAAEQTAGLCPAREDSTSWGPLPIRLVDPQGFRSNRWQARNSVSLAARTQRSAFVAFDQTPVRVAAPDFDVLSTGRVGQTNAGLRHSIRPCRAQL